MQTLDYEAAKAYAIKRLSQDLDNRFIYHCLTHTNDDVLPAIERLAAAAGIKEGSIDLLLLRTAAMYHDIGFLTRREEHEAASIDIAQSVLPDFGYSLDQIDRIRGMIQATRIPQSPNHFFEEILADADLDVLGRTDFMTRNGYLRDELESFGVKFTDLDWYSGQLKFITQHRYFTDVAQQSNQVIKRTNIDILNKKIATLKTNTHNKGIK
jgi:uncharacterized protein